MQPSDINARASPGRWILRPHPGHCAWEGHRKAASVGGLIFVESAAALNYRNPDGRAAGVVVVESAAPIQARVQAAVYDLDQRPLRQFLVEILRNAFEHTRIRQGERSIHLREHSYRRNRAGVLLMCTRERPRASAMCCCKSGKVNVPSWTRVSALARL